MGSHRDIGLVPWAGGRAAPTAGIVASRESPDAEAKLQRGRLLPSDQLAATEPCTEKPQSAQLRAAF